MTARRTPHRVVAVGVIAGILFVACGGSDGNRPPIALPTTTERTTTTRAPVTSTTEASSTSTTKASTTTTERATTTTGATSTTARATTTTEAPTTTEAATTTTEAATTTTEAATTTTEAAAPETVPVAENVEPTGDTVWPWVVLILLVVAAIVALIVSHRRGDKASEASWLQALDRAVGDGRLVIDELRHGSGAAPEAEPALGRRLRTLDATLTSLQAGSPSDADRTAITDARRAIGELVVAIDGDVRLQIGPPPPTAEQLATSRALINQHVLDFDATLERITATSHARS